MKFEELSVGARVNALVAYYKGWKETHSECPPYSEIRAICISADLDYNEKGKIMTINDEEFDNRNPWLKTPIIKTKIEHVKIEGVDW